MKKQVTMKDVAEIAKVSVSTVSRVVASKSVVKDKTAKRIISIIEQTGYKPNATARALALSKTDIIGIYIDKSPSLSLANSFFIEALEAIASELSDMQKEILLIFEDGEGNEKLHKLIESNRIDAVILLSVKHGDTAVSYLNEKGIPAILIGNPDNDDISSVNNDNVSAMKAVTELLLSEEHSKIAFVGGAKEYIVTTDRQMGYEEAMRFAGANTASYYVEFSLEGGYKLADELLEAGFTAAVCTDDLIAMGIKKRANEVGRDICVTGFNNTLEGRLSGLIYVSVEINAGELGKRAVELLSEKLDGNDDIRSSIVEAKIIKMEKING